MKPILFIIFLLISIALTAQTMNTYSKKLTTFEPSNEHPYGQPNLNAPEAIKDFDQLIGLCDCKSVQYRQGVANDTLPLLWKWKYILNGNAVQDEGWFGNDNQLQSSFTSIRILNPKTQKWNVPFFMPNMQTDPQIWNGGKKGNHIVLKRKIQVKSGDEIESILTFSNITNQGFDWEGKIVNHSKNTSQVFWKIWCVKRQK